MQPNNLLTSEEASELAKLSNTDGEPHFALEDFVYKLKTKSYIQGYNKAKEDIVEYIHNQNRFDVVN